MLQGLEMCHSSRAYLVAFLRLVRASCTDNMAKILGAGYLLLCRAQALKGFAVCFVFSVSPCFISRTVNASSKTLTSFAGSRALGRQQGKKIIALLN